MNRLPRNGTVVHHVDGQRHGKVDQAGHPPWGVQVRVQWDSGVLSWHPAEELILEE